MKHVNTFIKGLDKDTNINSYSNQSYPYALNLRILSDGTFESGTLTNMGDSKQIIQIPTGEVIVGLTTIRDRLIMFSKVNSTVGKIYLVSSSELLGNDEILLGASHLLTTKAFSFGDDVQVVARYETPSVQKVYWVDGVNPVRFANIVSTELSTQDVTKFNIVQEVELTSPYLNSIVTGTLPVGVYQYAYCLYDSNGAETAYSSATQPIPLSESSLEEATSMDFKGSNIGENSGKGIKLNIDNVDSDFTGIRVIRLFYSTQTGTPEVSIIYEGAVSGSTIITDSGGIVLGTLILEDYRYIPNIFSAKTLETKNDFLFAGNIAESQFDIDFDARAYRFFALNDGKVYTDDSFTSSFDVVDGGGVFRDVPEEYNFVASNKIQASSYWTGTGTSAIHQKNGTTIGGEGKNIKYDFVVKTRPMDNAIGSATPLKTFTNNYNDLSNPIVLHEQLGYQRSEIYRFGVVFYDAYGRQSFVKWIGDIRFPDENTAGRTIVSGLNIQDLGIRFALTTEAVDILDAAGVTGWQIVRAERTYADATVKDCGYVGSLENTSVSDNRVKFRDYLICTTTSNTRAPNALEYITPETVYNKNNNTNYNRVDLIGVSTNYATVESKNKSATVPTANSFIFRRYPSSGVNMANTSHCTLFNASKAQANLPLTGLNYTASLTNSMTPFNNNCVHGSTLLLRTTTVVPNATTGHYARRRSYNYPYNGYTNNAVKNTTYYPCSPIFSVDSTSREVFSGDCYIGIFEYMRGLMTADASIVGTTSPTTKMANQIAYLLVETKLNLMYTVNPRWSRLDPGTQINNSNQRLLATGAYTYNAMWETAGVHEAGVPAGGSREFYEQNYNLYTYNPVYSITDKSKVFFVKPDNLSEDNSIDTRIYRTTRKLNGELSDSWTKFPVNNLLDVDTKYGALSKLVSFKDRLFYFQEKGIGIIPIQEREVVTSQAGNATTLGVGGVMERYDYITTTSGTNNLYGVMNSNNSIYYIDTLNKKICKLGEGVEFLSDLKGIKSDMLSKPFTNIGVLFNPTYNELWFYIDNTTYIYNEYTGTFVSEVNDTPKHSFQINNKCFYVYGNPGYSRGIRLDEVNTSRDWELHVIANPNNLITNRFDSITFGSTKEDTADIPIDYITLSNRTQESFVITLNSSNTRHRFRNWIFNAVRDNNEMRMYDSYLKMILEGGADEKVKIYDILTNYTPINNR